jgi:hypothetical protein
MGSRGQTSREGCLQWGATQIQAEAGSSEHRSREKREGEREEGRGSLAGVGARRREQEQGGGGSLPSRVTKATGGERAEENGAAGSLDFLLTDSSAYYRNISILEWLSFISFQTKHA